MKREWLDPVAAWQRLHPKQKEMLGIAAIASGIADLGVASSEDATFWDSISVEVQSTIAAIVEASVQQAGSGLPDGIGLDGLGIQQCRRCGRTNSYFTVAGWDWVTADLCSDCEDPVAARQVADDLIAETVPADPGGQA
jgi:hypothetical protein